MKVWVRERTGQVFEKYVYFVGSTVKVLYRKNDTWLMAARLLAAEVKTSTFEKVMFESTNLCVYYAGGCCIHPECNAAHPRDLRGINDIYAKERAK